MRERPPSGGRFLFGESGAPLVSAAENLAGFKNIALA